MTFKYCVFFGLGLGFLLGCSPKPPPVAVVPSLHEVKLTMEIWEASTEEEKFAQEMLQRLRREDKRLKSSAAWKEFRTTKLIPAFEETVGIPYRGRM